VENRYKINFDLKNNTATDIKFKQGDNNSAVLEVTLYDGGASVDITDETIEFRFKKADENVVFQDMTHGVSIVGGAAQCILMGDVLSYPGIVICEIYRELGDAELIMPAFSFYVAGSIEGAILSGNYISSIEQIKTEYQAAMVADQNLEVVNARGAYPILGDRLNDVNTQIAAVASGAPKPFATLAELQADTDANTADGKKHIYVIAGNISEVDTLSVTGAPTVSSNVTVTLDGVAKTVAVLLTDTAIGVATKIRTAVYPGWVTGGSETDVTFTKVLTGAVIPPVFSAGTTGSTATFAVTTAGTNYGNWYWWNGSAWTLGGVFQATGVADGSVTSAKLANKAVKVENLDDNVLSNKTSSKALKSVLLPYLSNVDGALLCKSDVNGAFWSHVQNLAFMAQGSVTAYGITVTISGNTITISGTTTATVRIVVSGDSIRLYNLTPVLAESLPYNGNYNIKITPSLGSGCSLAIRKNDATSVGTTQGAISAVAVSDASYIFITLGSGQTYNNVAYALDIVKSGSTYSGLAPKNHQTIIDTIKSMFGFIATDANSTIEFVGTAGNQLVYAEKNTDLKTDVNVIIGADKFDVYIKGAKTDSYKYIQYPVAHHVKALDRAFAASNYDTWNIDGAFEVTKLGDFVFGNSYRLVNGGEWELAIFENGMSDFVGGWYHGDEIVTNKMLLVDNIIQDLTVPKNIIGKEIKFLVWSDLYRDNTMTPDALGKIATHFKQYTWAGEGLDLQQTVNWLTNLTVTQGYLSMLPIKRKVGNDNTGAQITDKAFTSDYIIYDVSNSGFTNGIRTPAARSQYFFNVHGSITGYSAYMEMYYKNLNLSNANGFVMGKDVNKAYVSDNYSKAIEELRSYGLQTWAAFTVGHDADTVESIRETCEFAIKSKFCFAAYNILMPYPGTPLYEELKSQNRLLYDGKWWLHSDYRFNHAAFVPKNMTPDELTEVSLFCRKKTNSIPALIYRAFEFRTNMRNPLRLMEYCLYNPLFRKETFKKQDMSLGVNDEEGQKRGDNTYDKTPRKSS